MRKLAFPEDKCQELEKSYHGKEKLPDRIYHAFQYWRQSRGSQATIDSLIWLFHIINMEDVSQKIRALKLYAQAVKL